MKIKIENTTTAGGAIRVNFSSAYGCGAALWHCEQPKIQPQSKAYYDVEFEVNDDLNWGENIVTTTKVHHSIAFEKGTCIITGAVVAREEDGCLSITLGDDIILLDCKEAPKNITGFVECRVSKLKLYPVDF